RGADHRAAGQRRELRRIDDAIDLVADTQDAAPVEERVAKRQTDVLRHGVAKVEAELGHDGKLVLAVLAKVRRQRQIADAEMAALAVGAGPISPAVDVGLLDRGAEADLGEDVHEETPTAPHHVRTDLTTVKLVAGVEAVPRKYRREGIGGTLREVEGRFLHAQRFTQVQEAEAT